MSTENGERSGASEGAREAAGTVGDAPLAAIPKVVSFDSLCRCGDEVWIEHGGTIYRLRRTRLGKLILTK